jgi:mono/diheme cytochrome c family protein
MRALFLVLPLLVLGGCPADDTNGTDATDDTDPVATVFLEADVMPVFTAHCAGCHKRTGGNDNATANGRYFEEKADILGLVGTFIQAGDSANSGLLGVMAGDTPVGAGPTPMPPMGDGVPQADLDTVAAWIDEGALDN